MKKWKRNQKGITLIALVITIVILLILAGITVRLLRGEEGILKRSEGATIQTQIAEIEEAANLIYADLLLGEHFGELESATIGVSDIVEELQYQYDIKQIALEGDSIEGISVPQSITVLVGKSQEIDVIFEGISNSNTYYAVVGKEYYRISLSREEGVRIAEESTPIETGKLTAISSSPNVTIEKIKENQITVRAGNIAESAIITIGYGDFQETCRVEVVLE